MSSELKKTSLKHFISYYRFAPWLGLLRYIEVEQARKVTNHCSSRVLDLGCGDGFVAEQAFQRPIYAGIDIDEKPLRSAKSRGTYELVMNADSRHLPFKNQTFATVYSNGAMEHMSDLNFVLKEVHRVLRPGGHLITLVPSHKLLEPIGLIAKILGLKIWNAFNMIQNHVNLLSPEQWHSLLAAGGFNMKSIAFYGQMELARAVCMHDLCSKLHLQPRWPFFTLRHGGNMAKMLLRVAQAFYPLPRVDTSFADSDFFWLMIVATRG